MDDFDVCASCSCHIKRSERACPFCGARHASTPRPARQHVPRMSRGKWLAFGGTLALLGCSGTAVPAPAGDAGAISAINPWFDPVGSQGCPVALSGTFVCGTSTCSRATEHCALLSGGVNNGCEANDAGYPFPAQCLSCPTCDCVTPTLANTSCTCVELDNGEGIGLECHGCYGAPPARLERLAAERLRTPRAARS
jgi:hypothetical protein